MGADVVAAVSSTVFNFDGGIALTETAGDTPGLTMLATGVGDDPLGSWPGVLTDAGATIAGLCGVPLPCTVVVVPVGAFAFSTTCCLVARTEADSAGGVLVATSVIRLPSGAGAAGAGDDVEDIDDASVEAGDDGAMPTPGCCCVSAAFTIVLVVVVVDGSALVVVLTTAAGFGAFIIASLDVNDDAIDAVAAVGVILAPPTVDTIVVVALV